MKKLNIGIIGPSGAVGKELSKLLLQRKFPDFDLYPFGSQSSPSFDHLDLAFFCVSNEIAEKLVPLARNAGVVCIDSSSFFRMDPLIPLVIPEINGHLLTQHKGMIASPNCTTTLMLLPLAPLHRAFGIKRIIVSTYQAVSGAGTKGMEELQSQTKAAFNHVSLEPTVFPCPCAFNVFPHESKMNASGYVEEECKMHEETQKILQDPTIGVSATCVRVPVFRAHSMALNVEFHHSITKEKTLQILANTPGVRLDQTRISTALDASNQLSVLCSRVRLDHTNPNTLEMWVVGDQLLKGAALNMMQIAEALYV